MEKIYCANCGRENEQEKNTIYTLQCSYCNNIISSPKYHKSAFLFFLYLLIPVLLLTCIILITSYLFKESLPIVKNSGRTKSEKTKFSSNAKNYESFYIYDKRMQKVRNIAIDNKNGKIALIHEYGWTEIPYQKGVIQFHKGFVAKMRPGFKLKALGSFPNSIVAYNEQTGTIVGGKYVYRLPKFLKGVLSMGYSQKKFYLVTRGNVFVYKTFQKDFLVKTHKIYGITGITAGPDCLYYCAGEKIWRCDFNFQSAQEISNKIKLTDITYHKTGILGIYRNKPYIYRIKLKSNK